MKKHEPRTWAGFGNDVIGGLFIVAVVLVVAKVAYTVARL